jgi:hypothetical protein
LRDFCAVTSRLCGGNAPVVISSAKSASCRCWRRCAGPRRGRSLFRNVPTFSRLRIFARDLVRVPRRVAITPDWPSYRIGARRVAATASVAATTATAAATAAAALRELYATPERSSIFIVENIKCRQADVRDFLLTKSDFVTHSGFRRRHIRCRGSWCDRMRLKMLRERASGQRE